MRTVRLQRRIYIEVRAASLDNIWWHPDAVTRGNGIAFRSARHKVWSHFAGREQVAGPLGGIAHGSTAPDAGGR